MKKLLLLVCTIVACVGLAWSANAGVYQIRELQMSPQGTASLGCTGWINASSSSGRLAGAVYDSGVSYAAISDSHGDMTLLSEGFALGVNGSGQAVGYADGAAKWDAAGNLTHLPLLINSWFSQARAINDSGAIVGDCWIGTSNVSDYIMLWNGGSQPINLGQGCGNAINAGGSVAGFTKDANGIHHGFVWSSTSGMISLAGGTASEANAINSLGQSAGILCDADSAWACVWTANGASRLLENLPGALGSTAWAINDSGAAVGSCDTSAGSFAVLWQPDGTIINLGMLPDNASSAAYGLSNSGLVAGCSIDSDGTPHAVVWSVVPEPSSVLALLIGISGIAPFFRKRQR